MNNKVDTKNMPPEKKRGLKPRLRFPEFRDAPEWEEKRLIDACRRVTQGGTPDTSNPDYWNGSIEWITPAEMGKTETRFISSTARKITNEGFRNCSSDLLPINSIIISTRAPIGYLAINTSPMAINQGCKGLIPRNSTNHDFLYYSLLNLKTLLIDLGAGNTFKELSGNSLKNFEIPLPNIEEQQKIADCLTSLDDLITSQSQKLDALKAHKYGLMQQLFPAEGETLPRLRFPEFQDAPEWEEKTLENACHLKAGEYVSASDIYDQYEDGLYPCYGGNGLRGYTRTFTHSGPYPLIGRQGALCGNVKLGTGQFHATEHAVAATPKGNIDVGWLFYNLVNLNLNQYATGQAQPGLSVTELEKVDSAIPADIKEQLKIADCLTSLDDLITAQTQKLDALKAHKKGLMQQLFPALDEVQA